MSAICGGNLHSSWLFCPVTSLQVDLWVWDELSASLQAHHSFGAGGAGACSHIVMYRGRIAVNLVVGPFISWMLISFGLWGF